MSRRMMVKDRFDEEFSKLESALDWVVFLSNDNETERQTIEPAHLKQAVQFIGPNEYEHEILVERNLNNLCGYPICQNQPKNIKKTIISPTRRTWKESRSYLQQTSPSSGAATMSTFFSENPHQSAQFCSPSCQDRSHYYLHFILKNSSLRSSNKRGGEDKMMLLEELDQISDRPTCRSSALMEQQIADPLVTAQVSDQMSQRTQPQHDFLEPLLTQFQSLNTTKWVDKNLNPIFSSIKIIEHAPQSTTLSSSSTGPSIPLAPDATNKRDPDQRFFDSTFSSSSSSGTLAPWAMAAMIKGGQDLNPIHELSSSLAETLTAQAIHSNSNPHRSRAPKPRIRSMHADVHPDPLPSNSHAETSAPGLLEAEIIYNVASADDQAAIDMAMALRDQLALIC
ncbi:hypothetical protein VP01_2016g2 [Puccinia sorghi]|uniref:RNA polymerase II subunit B1 CTD phosphatase RPAP2 homolog n=1 Tax=Puccinia sorghi TaxID=27349 RepID=A0A0L6VB92_9BASI|nr:hypothetical protein VP01_2016g2 [Puccinia sorghi]